MACSIEHTRAARSRLAEESHKAKADQIRTLDKGRLVKRIGNGDRHAMDLAEKAMAVHLAMILGQK